MALGGHLHAAMKRTLQNARLTATFRKARCIGSR
jgi:hypothetical protein